MSKSELLAIGGAYVDVNCPDFPFGDAGLASETEIVGDKYLFEVGGSAPNFARLCASLEVPTAFIGKVGDDEMGRSFKGLLETAGVKPALITDSTVQTNIGLNFINAAGQSIMAVAGSANQALRAEEVRAKVLDLLDTSSYLYIGGCFKLKMLLPAFPDLVAAAKKSGVKTVLDHGRITNGITDAELATVQELAQSVDYYLPSTDEFKQLWQVETVEEGLKKLARTATGLTVIKDGENGAITLVDNKIVHVPAFAVRPIHTIGAGDSFNAGFIAARTEAKTVVESMRFGCATAALKISQHALPTRQLVDDFIVNQ